MTKSPNCCKRQALPICYFRPLLVKFHAYRITQRPAQSYKKPLVLGLCIRGASVLGAPLLGLGSRRDGPGTNRDEQQK